MKLSEARKLWKHYVLMWQEGAYDGNDTKDFARELLKRDLKIDRLKYKLHEYTKMADTHEENQSQLIGELETFKKANAEDHELMEAMTASVDQLQTWVSDLHSGMYINCVYCGHRYGPNTEEGVMSEVLHAHVAACPEHPLSAALARISELTTDLGGWLQLARRWYLDGDLNDPKRPRLAGVNKTEELLNVPLTEERK